MLSGDTNLGIQLGMLNFYEEGQAFNLDSFISDKILKKNIIGGKAHLGDVCAVIRNVCILRLHFSIAFAIGIRYSGVILGLNYANFQLSNTPRNASLTIKYIIPISQCCLNHFLEKSTILFYK